MTNEQINQLADTIAGLLDLGWSDYSYQKNIGAVRDELRDAIAAARPPAGHIMEADGTVRPMARGFDGQPTRLDVTHDGFVVGNGAKLWRYNKARQEVELHEAGWYDRRSDRITWTPEVCWTTREAAEAARAAKGVA